MDTDIRVCKNIGCKKDFSPKTINQKFCSKKCYEKVHRPVPPKMQKICPVCGKWFSGNKKTVYCTDVCRKEKKNQYNEQYRIKDPYSLVCQNKECGRRFITRTHSLFCSKVCKSDYQRTKK